MNVNNIFLPVLKHWHSFSSFSNREISPQVCPLRLLLVQASNRHVRKQAFLSFSLTLRSKSWLASSTPSLHPLLIRGCPILWDYRHFFSPCICHPSSIRDGASPDTASSTMRSIQTFLSWVPNESLLPPLTVDIPLKQEAVCSLCEV